jgi:hypothetical protein
LALFGRQLAQSAESLVMPASKNLHNSGLMQCSKKPSPYARSHESVPRSTVFGMLFLFYDAAQLTS